jgi:negative regulator of flagellin synthesis FlgM
VIQPVRPHDASGIYQRQVEQAPEAGPVRRSGGSASGATSAAGRRDQVNVSSRAQQLRRVMETMPEVEEVRADRIAELRARIESGTYELDATQVAQRLLDDGLAL